MMFVVLIKLLGLSASSRVTRLGRRDKLNKIVGNSLSVRRQHLFHPFDARAHAEKSEKSDETQCHRPSFEYHIIFETHN